jgi:hypothetical protein
MVGMKYSILAIVLSCLVCSGMKAAEAPPTPATTAEPVPGESTSKADVIATPPATTPVKRQPAPAPVENVAGEDVDMIGDRPQPGAVPEKKKALLDELTAGGPLNSKAKNAYALIAEIKTNVDLIAKDLDNSGKEVTRLITTSDTLAKNITKLANIWPEEEKFRDRCGTAKRQALDLNEELARVPRIWTHVRWSFNAVVEHTRDVRLKARDLAEAEEKPVAVPQKDGTVKYVDAGPAPVDPRVARKEAILKADEAELARQKKDKDSREKPMKVDLDH